MVEWLLEPLGFAFMQRGFLAAVVVGVVCALVGCYMILRGMAFLGDALGHATLPGLAMGYLLSNGDRSATFFWALGTAVFTSIVMGALSRNTKLRHDTAIGIVFAGMFALGIAIISSVRSYAVDLTHMLFGNILGVTAGDLWLVLAVSLAVLLAILLFYKELLVVSFDPVLAVTLRLPVRALDILLHVMIAVAIVASLQTVGIALVVAMLVTPAATAFLLTKRFKRMMVLAAGIAAFSGVAGLYASYYLSIASGATIVLVCTLVFVLVYLLRGLLRPARRIETKSPAL
ncbi:MAG: metal ABC transporter permease [Anaerolineales bacterium]|nr:MAG: metal ABC transporter permease [Anaerolineales bacterium]